MSVIYIGGDYKFGWYETQDFDGTDPGAIVWSQLRIPNLEILPTVEAVVPERAMGTRQLADNNVATSSTCGVEHLVTLPPYDVARTEIAEWFRMAMQDGSEYVSSPYSKLIIPHSVQPDFSGESANLCYLVADHPGTSMSFLGCGCAMRELTVSVSADNPGGRLMLGGSFLSRRITTSHELNAGATFSTETQNYFDLCKLKQDNGACTFKGNDIILYGLDFTFANNVHGLGQDDDGYVQEYAMGGLYGVTGTLKFLRTADTAITDWKAGTISTLILQWQTSATFGETAGDLRMTIPCFMTGITLERTPTTEEVYSIDFTGVKTDSYDCMKFEVADGQDKAW